MRKFTINLLFLYKWHATILCIFIYLFLVIFFLRPINFNNLLGSLIFLGLLLSSIWNVSFLMLDSIKKDSPDLVVLGRFVLIVGYFFIMIYVMVF